MLNSLFHFTLILFHIVMILLHVSYNVINLNSCIVFEINKTFTTINFGKFQKTRCISLNQNQPVCIIKWKCVLIHWFSKSKVANYDITNKLTNINTFFSLSYDGDMTIYDCLLRNRMHLMFCGLLGKRLLLFSSNWLFVNT